VGTAMNGLRMRAGILICGPCRERGGIGQSANRRTDCACEIDVIAKMADAFGMTACTTRRPFVAA
jgi:hypothetical protein